MHTDRVPDAMFEGTDAVSESTAADRNFPSSGLGAPCRFRPAATLEFE